MPVDHSLGMKCPKCGKYEVAVKDSRPTEQGRAIRRRRECLKCKHRFTTYERQEGRRAELEDDARKTIDALLAASKEVIRVFGD